MSETASDGQTYITARHRHVTVYHATRECSRIEKPEYARERTAHYVEWHGLDPCEYCHG
jgi:hypothetical protein